ncbi:MAG: hemerythrin domain-containing protein [Phycisphaerales bacterium]|nr:hemerythrin domain-containing protein [Phycisphaerales bacterium]
MSCAADGGDFAAAMMGLHARLDALLFAHQRALLDRAVARARASLAQYRDALFAHAADEEAHVLPRYRALGGDATDAPTKLFLGEHDKLRALVDDCARRLSAMGEVADDRALLDVLDRQATLKNLLLHHDLRERNLLYPFLAARLPAAEQAAILAARRWAGGDG